MHRYVGFSLVLTAALLPLSQAEEPKPVESDLCQLFGLRIGDKISSALESLDRARVRPKGTTFVLRFRDDQGERRKIFFWAYTPVPPSMMPGFDIETMYDETINRLSIVTDATDGPYRDYKNYITSQMGEPVESVRDMADLNFWYSAFVSDGAMISYRNSSVWRCPGDEVYLVLQELKVESSDVPGDYTSLSMSLVAKSTFERFLIQSKPVNRGVFTGETEFVDPAFLDSEPNDLTESP